VSTSGADGGAQSRAATAVLVLGALAGELVVAVALYAQLWARGALCGIEYTPELEVWSPRDRMCSASWVNAVSFGLLALVPVVCAVVGGCARGRGVWRARRRWLLWSEFSARS